MKTPIAAPKRTSQPPVFPVVIRKRRTKLDAATPSPKSKKRDNVFSKSRDVREDRGERQMKTSHNPQSFSRSSR